MKSNPVSGIDLGAAPGHPDPGFLTDEGVAAVEEALPDQVSKTVWWLVAVSGVRTGEARALRWKAADKKHGKLWIDESRFEGQTLKPKSVRGKRGIDLSQHQLERLADFSLSACFRMAQYVGGRSASWYHELHLPETTG